MASPLSILCMSSYFKGNRFLQSLAQQGCKVYLLTVEKCQSDAWPRDYLEELFTVPNFANRQHLIYTVAYLMRTRSIDRIVALDDLDIELAAMLREHFRLTDHGHGESVARLFRDKLAMRIRAAALGIRIPAFCPIFHHAAVDQFLQKVPPPWLLKPRSEASAVGIHKIHNAEEAWHHINELGDQQSFYLLEQMVPGDLFHVDSLVRENQVIFAEVNAYYQPLLDVYQGGGIYMTRTLDRTLPDGEQLRACNRAVLEGFGLGQGASHTEFMKAHADGEFYFIETSARVGGASTAEMVEAASGVNLWEEWAKLEVQRGDNGYQLPPRRSDYAGVINSLAREQHPDTASFHDPEIVHRLAMPYHIGFVVASDRHARVQELLDDYRQRIERDHHHRLPPATKISH